MFGAASRPSHVNACRAVLLGGLAYWAAPVRADNLHPPEAAPSKTIVVTAKRRSDPLADEQVRKHVELALHSGPLFL